MPKVIWEEGRVEVLSHTYAVKSPLVTMARPKFAPRNTPSRGPIPKPHYLSHLWTRPTYDPFFHNALDRQTDRPTNRPTDRSRESLMTIGRCATRATRPKNEKDIKHEVRLHYRYMNVSNATLVDFIG